MQPLHFFKYNPSLNPKHDQWALKKAEKNKKKNFKILNKFK
jgi:hypothetical protein